MINRHKLIRILQVNMNQKPRLAVVMKIKKALLVGILEEALD